LAASILLILVIQPIPSFASSVFAPEITITNINNHRGATVSRDSIEISLTISAPSAITGWSLRILSTGRAFTSRSELGAFAASTKASGNILAIKPGPTPLEIQTPYSTSISVTGEKAFVRDLGVHGFWLQLISNGTVVRSVPFFAFGSGNSGIRKTPIAWMLPLVEPPHRDLLGNFNDDDLARALAPNGRLGRILNFGNGALTTWLIDPDLVETVEAMTHGYTFAHGEPGTGKAAAIAWLTQLRNATASDQVVALPYGDPDLVTLAKAGLKTNLAGAIDEGVIRLSALLQRPVTKVAAWPTEGLLNRSTLSLAQSSAATTLLLSSNSVVSSQTATESSVLPTRTAPSQLLYDSTLARQFDNLTPLSANRAAAELTMITAERPAIARAQLILPPRLWNPNNESIASVDSGAPVHEITLEQLESSRVTLTGTIKLTKLSPLGEGEIGILRVINRNLNTFSLVHQVVSQSVQNATLRSALLLSTTWRGRGFNAYLYELRAQTASERIVRQIRVISGRYTLTSLKQRLPITIANDSTDPATVTLRLVPTTFRVLQPEQLRLTLEAKSKTQVMVPIHAITSGDLILVAMVLTPNGEILGDASELSLSIRTVPAIANWIMEGAGIALILAAGAQIIRRLRRRKKTRPDGAPLGVDQR